MISDARLKEIVEYSTIHGTEETVEAYAISEESLNRLKRAYRQKFGDTTTVLSKIRDKFSDEELASLLTMDTSKKPKSEALLTFEGEDFKLLALSDTHIGSMYFDDDFLLAAMAEGRKQGCTAMLHGGDVVEGMSTRPGQIYELTQVGYAAQRNKAVELLKQWERPLYFILGNHDLWTNTKSGVGTDLGEDLALRIPQSTYLGIHEGTVKVNGATFMLWHGEDGSSYASSYRVQKIIEAFTGGEKPNVLLTAHTHKALYLFDRNIHAVSTGSIQRQSGFMRYKRLAAHTGFWIIGGKIRDGEIVQFTPTWYPFYK
jgi:predicted phosphodiesterase